MACEAMTGQITPDEREEKLWRAGGAVVRAILFVMRSDEGDGLAKAA